MRPAGDAREREPPYREPAGGPCCGQYGPVRWTGVGIVELSAHVVGVLRLARLQHAVKRAAISRTIVHVDGDVPVSSVFPESQKPSIRIMMAVLGSPRW